MSSAGRAADQPPVAADSQTLVAPVGWLRSLRTRFLAVVLLGVVAPLGLVGLWLTRAAVSTQQTQLEVRLEEALDQTVDDVGLSWNRLRSELLSLTEDAAVLEQLRRARGGENGTSPAAPGTASENNLAGSAPPTAAVRYASLQRVVVRAELRDGAGRTLWVLEPASTDVALLDAAFGPTLRVRVPVYELNSGGQLGTLTASLVFSELLAGRPPRPGPAGMVVAARDEETGAALLPLPFDPAVLVPGQFELGGEEWLASRRELTEPPVQLLAAAPLTPLVDPVERTARRGAWVLGGVAVLAMLLATVLTRRMTRSLGALTVAADGVSSGRLGDEIDVGRDDEVGRVGRAFNAMTRSLKRTLQELADRRALAAVGEFAASLSHEVRNALTSVRIDMQWVEEQLTPGSEEAEVQARALAEVKRLDDAVTDALQMARSGRVDLRPLDPLVPLRAAAHAAMPEFTRRGAQLVMPTTEPEGVGIQGDSDTLEQLFLNLLLNAAQALPEGGTARVSVQVVTGEGVVVIRIDDDGDGIPPGRLEKIFEPFFSTRADGTGLGLGIARRIVQLHGGSIELDSHSGEGTRVSVRLPLVSASSEHST